MPIKVKKNKFSNPFITYKKNGNTLYIFYTPSTQEKVSFKLFDLRERGGATLINRTAISSPCPIHNNTNGLSCGVYTLRCQVGLQKSTLPITIVK